MLADWVIELELGPCNTAMENHAHEIVGAYKDVYYAHRRIEADREAERVAATRSRAVQVEA